MKKVFFIFPVVFLLFICGITARNKKNIFSPVLISGPNDYYRSATTGDWSVLATWESSPDNGITPWAAATLIPSSTSDIISIRNTHTVTVSSDQSMDQVIIESGGILLHSGGILTIIGFCGCGDDLVVQSGGYFILSSSGNPPVFSPASATAKITQGGILRVSAGSMTGIGTGVNAINYIYQHGSILELTIVYSTNGVTYFPNVAADTIPVFRSATNLNVGSAGVTTFNGLFEAVNSFNIDGSGQKIFRNGITGTGNINGSTSGKFIINGATASLGGSGSLTLPAGGMDIGSSTTITMISDKSVTDNIALQSNALVMLGSYNLTMTGDISGGSTTSHIVTNSSGKLVINNITGATPRIFPIGATTTTINPIAIFNGNNLNYGARVEIGINPSIRYPIAAVNRTWVVRSSGTPGPNVNVNFFYNNTDGNPLFNYAPATVEQGFYTGVWNVINTGLTQFFGPPNYQVTTLVSLFAANTDAPMVIGNIPAILEGNNSIRLTAQKQNDKAVLSWSVYDPAVVAHFIPEHSVDGRSYTALAVLSSNDLDFTDIQPSPGLNYYRIKMTDKDGKITYSDIAAILNSIKGFDIISITSNPIVNRNFKLNASAAQKIQMDIMITDMQGRVVQKQRVGLIAGFNVINMNVRDLARGIYQLYGYTADGRSKLLRFVVR